ncbi:transmembrane protein 232-like isoform X2 [Anneissia japonica]|uniref:transmembrane protein 232-like isoform X2 n=1 Tax=Anneissia japonica TaxID=1529436 RepID=UPI0014256DEE|nr:transmembrane protein 232-like isoform X2 [Anneissia japonica]
MRIETKMPITKVPIVHKFGIISHSQREELQERLMKQKFLGAQKSSREIPTTRNPLELTEEFIHKFNAATDFEAKEELEEVAFKILARAKRRVGLKDASKGSHVDLPKAWSELSVLAQCRGKVQEECLDVMIISLNQAPLSPNNINCLFYLGETTLYWLRTDAMNQPFLRIGEIKLLKMGQLVFTRLFFHHMAGHLHGYKECKDRLITYLEALIRGFTQCEEAYSPYPSAHLALQYIAEVGAMIVGDNVGDAGEIKESDNIIKKEFTQKETETNVSGRNSAIEKAGTTTFHDASNPACLSRATTIHDLSPSLWHSLDVWRCTVHLSDGFQEAVKALTLCGTGLASENWIDALCAFKVLSEAAKANLTVLRALQNLAKGIVPPKTPVGGTPIKEDEKDYSFSDIYEDEHDSASSLTSTKSSFSDLETSELKFDLSPKHGSKDKPEKKKTSLDDYSSQSLRKLVNISMTAMIDTPQDKHADSLTDRSSFFNKDSRMLSTPATLLNISSRENLDSAGELSGYGINQDRSPSIDSDLLPGDDSQVYPNQVDVTKGPKTAMRLAQGPGKMKREVSFDASADRGKDDAVTEQEQKRGSESLKKASGLSMTSTKTGRMVHPGSVPMATSLPSTPKFPSRQLPNMLGLIGWRWQVAFAYTELMGYLCLHGSTSNIRKVALIGDNKQDSLSYRKRNESLGVPSAGLLDLVNFKMSSNADDNDQAVEDWSWRIRYCAVQGLVKICRCTQGDKSNEGMRTVAWNTLMKCHSREKDDRVLEAIRVGQVDAQIEKEALKIDVTHSLDGRLAAGLSSLYLPPLAPPVAVAKRSPRRKVELPKPSQPLQKSPNRPSLKEELLLSTALQEKQPSFTTRTSLDLKRIVEDQWRKELQDMLQQEEDEKEKELEERQNQEEIHQKQAAERKIQKFKKSSKSPVE